MEYTHEAATGASWSPISHVTWDDVNSKRGRIMDHEHVDRLCGNA